MISTRYLLAYVQYPQLVSADRVQLISDKCHTPLKPDTYIGGTYITCLSIYYYLSSMTLIWLDKEELQIWLGSEEARSFR